MSDTIPLTYDQAVSLLPEGDSIHTMKGSGFFVGCDWSRESILKAIADSPTLELSGLFARGMRHGLKVMHNGSAMFVETVPERVDALAPEKVA